ELVEMLGLDAYRNKFVAEVSTGTRRMVDLACILAHEPSVILFDEPSSGIAQRETEALGPVLRRVREMTGASLLVIEHDMPLLTSLADEIIALELGRAAGSNRPSPAAGQAAAGTAGGAGGGAQGGGGTSVGPANGSVRGPASAPAATTTGGPANPSAPGPASSPAATTDPWCDPATGRLKIPTLYAAPCVPPFSGDNGGATYNGVTAQTITVAVPESNNQAQASALRAAANSTDTQ